MNIERTVLDYIGNINPTLLQRLERPETLKLRRVLDSLDMVDFLAFLEKTFSVRITDQDVLSRNFETIGSVIDFVKGRSTGGGAQD